jgi:hypothetical protein
VDATPGNPNGIAAKLAKMEDTQMSNRLIQFFSYEHLPAHLQAISKRCGELAQYMDETLDENAEKTVGLRKLLEAKDCFVRALLEKKEKNK